MAGVTENVSKFEGSQIFASRVSQSEVHRRLVSVYGQNVFSRKEVSLWCYKFQDNRMALNGDQGKVEADQRPPTLMKIASLSKVW
jgi:hypothetical protein